MMSAGLQDAAACGPELERRRPPLGAHPLPEVAQVVADLAAHDAQLREIGFLGRFVQVLPQRFAEGLLPLPQRLVETPQHRAAEGGGAGLAAVEIVALGRREGADAGGRGVFCGHGGWILGWPSASAPPCAGAKGRHPRGASVRAGAACGGARRGALPLFAEDVQVGQQRIAACEQEELGDEQHEGGDEQVLVLFVELLEAHGRELALLISLMLRTISSRPMSCFVART